MSTTVGHRYVQRIHDKEKQYNIHVKEMIQMVVNEEVKENLYIKGVKLSNHAMQRMSERFDIHNLATATRMVKDKLKKATRIGTILSYDGRINVMYACEKMAILLSPDLKTVVTVGRYEEVTHKSFLKKAKTEEELVNLHWKYIKYIEQREEEQIKKIISLEEKVREANELLDTLLHVGRGGRERKKKIKALISEQNHQLKIEGWKLFRMKVRKRSVCKSLVSLY